MKVSSEVKFPNAANLFSFCREILDRRFNDAKVRGRVIDQDVGQILGMDPADCSHWKRGKKPIRSIDAIRTIAQQLNVDEQLVAQVASGELNDFEALLEYEGPGEFSIDHRQVEVARKDWFRKLNRDWSKDEFAAFRSMFTVDNERVDEIVKSIHERIHFSEAPLFFPEIFAAYPELKWTQTVEVGVTASPDVLIPRLQIRGPDVWEIEGDAHAATRPVIRYYLARAMAPYFLRELMAQSSYAADLQEFVDRRNTIYYNVFAAKLLAPIALIQRELTQIDLRRDIVSQLAATFWVSRGFMNTRLRDVLIAS